MSTALSASIIVPVRPKSRHSAYIRSQSTSGWSGSCPSRKGPKRPVIEAATGSAGPY